MQIQLSAGILITAVILLTACSSDTTIPAHDSNNVTEEEILGENTYVVDDDGGYDYTTIQACADAAQPGYTCLVREGTYNESVTPPRDGSEGSWITFRASVGHNPVMTGSWELRGRHYLVIDGFEVRGGFNSHPSSWPACSNIKVQNNYINGAAIGVNIKGNDVLISGNTFDNLSNDMVRQFGDRWTIRNNTVIGEIEPVGVHMDFWQSFCCDGVSASYTLIENNEYIDITGGDAHFALVNGTSSCGDPVTNMIFRYNKIRNIGSLGIYIDTNNQTSGCRDNSVYNNTFVDMSAGIFDDWQDYCIIFSASDSSNGLNNIFYNAVDSTNAIGFLLASEGYQAHNLYYDPDTAMTFYGDAVTESGSITNEDPLLVNSDENNFSLKTGSPAINKGGPLTCVAGADSGSGTTLIVAEAEFFQPGWGGADPDWIAVGSPDNVTQIVSIDYDNNALTISSTVLRIDGDPVYLYRDSDGTVVLKGAAPDIGAMEY